ncbi:MAG TPA: UbiD family decarboxylase [Acidimicrobiia bacterium]|jgi:4-hydroxy-3-polyprenylbenzoate decarboxylase
MKDAGSITDLRDWLAVVDGLGELTTIDGAHWDLEIGAISRLNYRRPQPRALLFDNIPGYPQGFRVITGTVSNARRTGLTLRLGTDLDNAALVSALSGKPNLWAAEAARYEPLKVDTAAVFENVVEASDVDLTRFPAPRWNELDGGRFIGTGCMVFTTDPDTGAVNGGAYRLQLQDEGRTFTVSIVPGKHGAQNVQKWFEREGRAPVTVSLGHDPLLFMLAGTEVPTGVSELAYAGAVLGRPVEIVLSEITGLPIPASSEIAVEGWLTPDRTYPEGPFAEWTGHYTGSPRPVVALDVARVLYRDAPIILGSPPGKPPHDFSYMRTVIKSAMIQDAVTGAGVPGVSGVWAHEQGGGRMLIVVAIDQKYHGHARQAGYIASQSQAGAYMNRFVIVVDDDIDHTDLGDVVWAMCTRCDPATDIDIMRKSWGGRVDPLLADKSVPYNSRALIDACRPFERKDAFPPLAETSPELLERTAAKWSKALGFDATALVRHNRRQDHTGPLGSMDGS